MRETREYRWPPSHAFLIKPTDDMNDILFNQVKMDTQTVYQVNGDMFITPASYEQHKAPIMEKRLCYKGSVHLDEDGKAHVKRYNIGSQGTPGRGRKGAREALQYRLARHTIHHPVRNRTLRDKTRTQDRVDCGNVAI